MIGSCQHWQLDDSESMFNPDGGGHPSLCGMLFDGGSRRDTSESYRGDPSLVAPKLTLDYVDLD